MVRKPSSDRCGLVKNYFEVQTAKFPYTINILTDRQPFPVRV